MKQSSDLVEQVTRRVLAELSGKSDDHCADCCGSCAAHCSDKVSKIVAEGAGRISFNGNGSEVPAQIASYIDHTLLSPGATAGEVDRLCDEARQYAFASVCVNPVWVKRAAQNLKGSGVPVTSVIGFPLGANATEIKVLETRRALREGAREIDMVLNIGALKGGDLETVERDIVRVVDACREVGAICKVIIETALLTDEEKVIASQLASRARADFVKTSTGFGPGGATVFDVAIMRETVGPKMGIKASGGIKTSKDIHDMIAAGATRIGASAGVEIVSGKTGGASGKY